MSEHNYTEHPVTEDSLQRFDLIAETPEDFYVKLAGYGTAAIRCECLSGHERFTDGAGI
jgi:hypothetical protein